MFRSHDHPQGANIVSCYSYNLKHSVKYFVMLTLVLWQHVVFLCASRTLFRMSLVMDVRCMLCTAYNGMSSTKKNNKTYFTCNVYFDFLCKYNLKRF